MAHGRAPLGPEVVVGEFEALAHPIDHQEVSENLPPDRDCLSDIAYGAPPSLNGPHLSIPLFMEDGAPLATSWLWGEEWGWGFMHRGKEAGGVGCGGIRGSGFRVQGSGFRVQGSGFRVQGSGSRVQGSGFRAQGTYDGLLGKQVHAAQPQGVVRR